MTKHLPTSANALLIALQTPAPKGHRGIPVLLWGRPGVGKSSFLEDLARENFPVLTLIASIHDPTDFSGLPIHEAGKVRYAIPEWVEQFGEEGEGILFLDELTTAPPSVQAALLRVVLERKVGFHDLPAKVRIVAAANPPDLMTGGWELTPPLRNRFVHLQWDLPVGVYLNALENGFEEAVLPQIEEEQHQSLLPKWKLLVAAFLKRSPDLLHTTPDSDPYTFASPRSWDFVASLMASCELLEVSPLQKGEHTKTCVELLRGCLGEGPAITFLEFLQNLKLPDPIEVLDGIIKVDVKKLNDSELYVFFGALNRVLKSRFERADFYESVLRYFDITQAVFDDGRRDVIYVSLRRIVRANLLMKAMSNAKKHSQKAYNKLMRGINVLFVDEGLSEFVAFFERE